MKFSTTLIATSLLIASFASAEVQPRAAGQVAHPRHHQRSDAIKEKALRREAIEREEADEFLAPKKRGCKKSSKSKSKSSSKSGSGSGSKDSSSAKVANKQASSKDSSKSDDSSSKSKSHDNDSKSDDGSKSKSDNKSIGSALGALGKGLFGWTNDCGESQASNNDPNGAKWWLNCGADSDGWRPANVKLSDIKVISDDEAAKADVFKPCAKYASEFKAAHQATGIPVAILMSIAMQESTCNPSVTGQRGEIGMMQITPDKCGGAPGGNCHDTEFNIKKGGEYLQSTTKSMGGNFLKALGQYNGWTEGMKASGSCGPQGQNMDYLNGNLNRWFQGKNGYATGGGSC